METVEEKYIDCPYCGPACDLSCDHCAFCGTDAIEEPPVDDNTNNNE